MTTATKMTTRERFNAVLNFQDFDRLPIVEWASWWNKTTERWEAEGMPPGFDKTGIMEYWGMDVMLQNWVSPRCRTPRPLHHGAGLLKTADQYRRFKKDGLLYNLDVLNLDMWRNWAERQKRGEVVLWFTLDGFFWFPRTLFGIQDHLYAFYDNAELMHEMCRDLTDFNLKVIDAICSICKPEFMTFGEDMSYNHGPMLSEVQFDEFMLPYYQQLCPRLREHGVKSIIDSDGDITMAAPWFEKAGLDGILPLERQSGVDVALLRRTHPRQIYIGAYDKMVMNKGEDAIRAEFERLLPTARQGGFIISVDHQTPPGVSMDDYRVFLGLFREYATKAAHA